MRQLCDERDARRLLIGGPVALVTTNWRAQNNVMPVAWSTPLSIEPPLVGIAVHPSRHTSDMIRFSEEFAINIPGRKLINHSQYFGLVSGRDSNKIEAARIPTFRALRVSAPLLEGCVAHIECGLEDVIPVGDHNLFVGRVLKVHAEMDAFSESWLLDDDDLKPLHYLGGSSYAILGGRLEAVVRTTEEEALIPETPEEREEREEREARQREEAESHGEEAKEA